MFSACTLLTACAGETSTVPYRVLQPHHAATAAASVYVAEKCAPGTKTCSPANGFVQELGGGMITDRVVNPVEIAFDTSGNLFVSNAKSVDKGNVTVYATRTGRLLRTVTGFRGVSYALAISRKGALNVVSDFEYGCCDIKGSVAVYAPGGARPIRRLSGVGSFPGRPAFDAYGNLYVPNFDVFPGYINVYAPNANTPFRSITQGIGFPMMLALDRRGLLFVLNNVFGGGTNVRVYEPKSGRLLRTIKDGLSNSSAIALDAAGNLYVANRGTKHDPASVTIYAPGMVKPARSIRNGIRYPIALAFDAGGDLYVANAPAGTNTVTVYAPESGRPEKTYSFHETVTALAVR